MKNVLALIFLVAVSIQLKAQTSIKFKKNKPLEEILAKAKKENKIVFIDAYTTWCGPCKMMDRDVFSDAEVASFYNEKFINAKFDMEKGEGPSISQRFSVRGYPSYLFLDGDGELVHRGIGYIQKDEFLKLGDQAAGDNSIKALGDRYEANKDNPEFLYNYASMLVELGENDRADKVVSAYLASKKDWSDENTMKLVIGSPGKLGGKRMNYIMDHSSEFETLIGSSEFIGTLQNSFIVTEMERQRKRALPSQKAMAKIYGEHAGTMKDQLLTSYEMILAERSRDRGEYAAAAVKYYDTYPSNDSQELNSIAWKFYEMVNDKEQLKSALEWSKRSVEINKGYANMDTLAWLYYKTGQKDMAKEVAKQAIEIAKATGQDYAETAKMLK